MKKKFIKNLRIPVMLCTGIVIIVAVIFYAKVTDRSFKNQAYYSVKQSVDSIENTIDSTINYALSSIELTSVLASKNIQTEKDKNPVEIINSYVKSTPFTSINYIDKDGIYYVNSGEKIDVRDRHCYKDGLNGNSGICVNYTPANAKETLVNFYTPLFEEDKINGILVGALGSETSIKQLLDSSFYDYKKTGFLCDEDFKIIATTSATLSSGANLNEYKDNSVLDLILEHANSNNTQPFSIKMKKNDNQEGVGCVAKLKSCGWYVIQIVPPASLSAMMGRITLRAIILITVVIIVLLAYLIYIIYNEAKERKENSDAHLNIINALSTAFENVLIVDGISGEVYSFEQNDFAAEKYEGAFTEGMYEENLKFYIESAVYEEDKSSFDPILTLVKVERLFQTRNNFSFTYRVIKKGGTQFYECELIKPSKERQEFVVALKNIDKVMQERQQVEQALRTASENQAKQIELLSSISSIYLTMHLLDLEKKTVAEFNTTTALARVLDKSEKADLQMRRAMTKLPSMEYVEEMLDFTDFEHVQQNLKGKKIISKEFVSKYSGWVRASFITVKTNKLGVPVQVYFLTQNIEDEKKKEQHMLERSTMDVMTGIFNRWAYEDDKTKIEAEPVKPNFVFISMDVNGLKAINDTKGHQSGNLLIIGAAHCMKACFGKYGNLYRTGGDEFEAMIYATHQQMEEITAQIKVEVEKWTEQSGIPLSFSIGYVEADLENGLTLDEMERLADSRMYEDKERYYSRLGKDRRLGRNDIVTAVSRLYLKIIKVDFKNDTYSIIYMQESERNKKAGFESTYSKWFESFISKGMIHPEDEKNLRTKTSIKYIRDILRHNDTFEITYRRKIGEKYCPVVMNIVYIPKENKENEKFFLFVRKLTE